MYNPSFPSTNVSQNTNPSSFSDNSNYTVSYSTASYDHDPEFGLSGFGHPVFGDNYAVFQELEPLSCFSAQDPAVKMHSATQEIADISYGSSSSSHNFACKGFLGPDGDWPLSASAQAEGSLTQEHKEDMKRANGQAIAFRTLSEFENLDDGYKWRKYGKKMLKTSTHPRNYYKCSNEGCKVKKRVERDEEDHRYVLTTYEGVHNHQSPSPLYSYDTLVTGWTCHQPSSHSHI